MPPVNHKKLSSLEKASIAITNWVGTTQSVLVHTFFFIAIFGLQMFGFTIDSIMLILTTVVSLEAIYLSLFIQMTVNRNTQSLEEVGEDIEEIQDDVGELQEDVDEIEGDVDKMQEHVEDLGEEFDDISEDIEEMRGEDEPELHEELAKDFQSQNEQILRHLQKLEKDMLILKQELKNNSK